MREERLARLSLYLLFLIPGFGLASWVTRTPALRDGLGASTQQMGIILFGFSSGAMTGVLTAGWLTQRYGAKRMTQLGLLAILSGLGCLALSVALQNSWIAIASLFAFGLGIGWAEIAMNVEAAAVERAQKISIMTTLHGFFSLGTLIGALLGMVMTAMQVPMLVHLVATAAVGAVLMFYCLKRMPTESAVAAKEVANSSKQGSGVLHELKDVRMLLTCFVVLAMALAEGTANDWLPLLMIDGHGFDATMGTMIYVGFTLSMTIGRFAGSGFVSKVGTVGALCTSAIFGTIGLAIIIFTSSSMFAALAVVLWGLGASLGFPLAISLAGESGRNSALRVSIAATGGYVGFLVGPPMLGFLGEHYGLRMAMLPVGITVALAFFAAWSIGRVARQRKEMVA